MTEWTSVVDLFRAFVGDPTEENYAKVRTALVSVPSYHGYSEELGQAVTEVTQGRYREAKELVCGAWNNLLLSPLAHMLLAEVHEKLGDRHAREMELAIASVCLLGILGTGDGSRDHPYVVVRISDEYDVLQALKKEPGEQALCELEGRSFDRWKCADGSEIWFDITDAKKSLRQSMLGTDP